MSFSKHVVNEPRQLVYESLAGLARLNPDIRVDSQRVVSLADVPQDRVALVSEREKGQDENSEFWLKACLPCLCQVSGGGSGHEVLALRTPRHT
jgi:dihydroxyacetone kinase